MYSRTLVLVNHWTDSSKNWCGQTFHLGYLKVQVCAENLFWLLCYNKPKSLFEILYSRMEYMYCRTPASNSTPINSTTYYQHHLLGMSIGYQQNHSLFPSISFTVNCDSKYLGISPPLFSNTCFCGIRGSIGLFMAAALLQWVKLITH